MASPEVIMSQNVHIDKPCDIRSLDVYGVFWIVFGEYLLEGLANVARGETAAGPLSRRFQDALKRCQKAPFRLKIIITWEIYT